MKKAVIVGCTSGIGKALTEELLAHDYVVGGMGRNGEKLQELEQTFPKKFVGQVGDIRNTDALTQQLDTLIKKLGGMELCVVSSGIARKNPDLEWEIEQKVLQTNIMGYSAVLIWAGRYFLAQGYGHLVGITSLAKYLGGRNPAYTASKAFEGIYLDGLRLRLERKGVFVTEIMPGFVKTPLTADQQNMFWAISPQKAAKSIFRAIQKRKRKAVVSLRWKPFRCLLPHLPYWLLKGIL